MGDVVRNDLITSADSCGSKEFMCSSFGPGDLELSLTQAERFHRV